MKKILAILFFVSVLCPVLSAELFASDVVLDKKVMAEIGNQIQNDTKLTSKNISISEPATINKKYVTEEQGYFNGVNYEEGLKMTTNSYNIISVIMPANDSIMKQIKIDQFSETPAIYFNDENNAIIVKNQENENDKIFIKLDYKFSLLNAEDESQWKAANPDSRTIEGKMLQLTIKYAPKYFTFTKEENEAANTTYPILTFENKSGTTKLYLVPTDAVIKDFNVF